MKTRPFHPADTAVLLPLHNRLHPDDPHTAVSFARFLADLRAAGGRAWVAADPAGAPVGYALALPLPGLPGVVELDGGIAPAHRRQGHGTRLLQHLLADLAAGSPIRHASACVPTANSPTGRFLLARGFVVEHEEWVLEHPLLTPLPALALPAGLRVAPLPTRRQTIATFCDLYARSFAPHPWHQPYSRAEAAATLQSPTDILFLHQTPSDIRHPKSDIENPKSETAIGFAWLRLAGATGEIEPFGIVPEAQGRGYGRILLTAALHTLAQRGAQSAHIGAWRANAAALHLYQQLGFRPARTLTYLSSG